MFFLGLNAQTPGWLSSNIDDAHWPSIYSYVLSYRYIFLRLELLNIAEQLSYAQIVEHAFKIKYFLVVVDAAIKMLAYYDERVENRLKIVL